MIEKAKQEACLPMADLLIDDDTILEFPQHSDSKLPRLLGYQERFTGLWRQGQNKASPALWQ